MTKNTESFRKSIVSEPAIEMFATYIVPNHFFSVLGAALEKAVVASGGTLGEAEHAER